MPYEPMSRRERKWRRAAGAQMHVPRSKLFGNDENIVRAPCSLTVLKENLQHHLEACDKPECKAVLAKQKETDQQKK